MFRLRQSHFVILLTASAPFKQAYVNIPKILYIKDIKNLLYYGQNFYYNYVKFVNVKKLN